MSTFTDYLEQNGKGNLTKYVDNNGRIDNLKLGRDYHGTGRAFGDASTLARMYESDQNKDDNWKARTAITDQINQAWFNYHHPEKNQSTPDSAPGPLTYPPDNDRIARDAQERANTIGQWEDELAYINSKLSNLDTARKTAQNTINDNFNIQDQRLDQQKAVADQRYNRHRNETKRSFMENRDANAAQSRDMYQSVMRLLGRGGAGSSSTANILAPHAIAQDSSKKNALIADTYRKDVEDIDEAANQAQVDYDNKKFDLSKWKKDQERDLNADTEAKRSDFLTKKAKAETNLGLARGDSWRRARSAANPTIAEREQVDRAISTLADSYRTPAPQKDLDVKDIERKNYVVDTAGVSVDQPEGEETSNANYYLDRMEEERRRKSKKLGITPAPNNN